jgi:D-alanyl-D-alanine carboxypeptidase
MEPKQLTDKLEKLCRKAEAKNEGKPFQFLIHSDRHNLHFAYPDQSEKSVFHIASIGKLFTTVLLLQLVEEGKCNLEDKLIDYLDPNLLSGLFLSGNDQIRIVDCLTHRSGAADFFEGKNKKGLKFVDEVIRNPSHEWTQTNLLEYVRQNMKPVGKNGAKFNYCDTGFLLVCMVIEKITQLPLHRAFEEKLFMPLRLTDTQSMIYRYPKNQAKIPLDIWFNAMEIKKFKSLSCDQADGGIVSTPLDIVSYQQALYSNRLINHEHVEMMQKWQGKFRSGIHYGMGMMQLRFEEFFFMMRNFPRLVGHIGILSTHAFYDLDQDIHYVLNLGSNTHMTQSFVLLSNIVGTVKGELKKGETTSIKDKP